VEVALTPDEIEGREFHVVDQGYDMVQVDTFLTEVAASYRYAVHNLLPGASGVGQATGRHPSGGVTPDALTRVGQEVAEILRSAEKVAETVRNEADAEAAAVRARADLEAAELRQAAERDREQAKRLLTHAQEQSETIVAEAGTEARALVEQAEADATQRADEVLGRSRRHAEQILRAERAVIERLHEVRSDVDSAIDRLAGSEDRPVLDLTSGEPVLRVGGPPAADDDPDAASEAGDEDPVRTMVRNAVGRAAEEGAAAEEGSAGEGSNDDNGAAADRSEAGQPTG
jgi:DivIVA domain-containing protein